MRKFIFLSLLAVLSIALAKVHAQSDSVDSAVVFTSVETIPVFPGCEALGDNDALLHCFDKQLGRFLSENINYPEQAFRKKVQGTIYIQFVIGKDGTVGSVENIRPDRRIGYGLEEEALRVVALLPRMRPATQKGQPTTVKYIVPIQFRLQ